MSDTTLKLEQQMSDVSVSEHVALRVFRADYLLTKLANHVNDTQNNFSFSAGVVFTFGSH